MHNYPRSYSVKPGWRVFFWVVSAATGLPCLYGIWYFAKDGHALLAAVMGLMALVAVYLAALARRAKMVLHADRFEVRDAIRTRAIQRDQIAGWRIVAAQYTTALVLENRDPSIRPVAAALVHETDAQFLQWFEGLPNLDEKDKADAEQQILNDSSLGETVAERNRALEKAKALARSVNLLSIGVSLWGFFYPKPYGATIAGLLIVPWIAALIAWRSRGLIQFDGQRNDVRPNVAASLLFPGMILAVRAAFDFQVTSWYVPVMTAAAIALTSAIAFNTVAKLAWTQLASLVFFLWFYSYGAVVEINDAYGSERVRIEKYVVLEKTIKGAKRTTYHLHLQQRRGDPLDLGTVEVRRNVFEQINKGDSACLHFHTGLLRIEWYSVRACEESKPE